MKECRKAVLAAALALIAAAVVNQTTLSAQGRSGGRNQILANERVTVMRLTAAAGLIEQMHITPQDVVAVHALFNRGTTPVDMLVVMLANGAPALSGSSNGQRSAAEAGPANRVIDNERVSVMRVPAPVGMKQEMHKSPEDLIAIQSTPGQIEVAVGTERTAGAPWNVWYLPKTLDHAVLNTGTMPVEMVVIALK